ncbi:MAG: DUF4421 family protein [Chryseolinea sp.]
MRSIALILLLSLAGKARAQQVELAPSMTTHLDSVRAKYIKSYPDHFFIWPLIKQRRLDFRLQDTPSHNKLVTYKSNKPYFVGVGLYIFEVVLEITGAVPFQELSESRYGKTYANDLQLNLFGKQWSVESFRQRYRGFYISDPDVDIAAGAPYPQRADLVTRNTGITGSYAFNKKKFSYRSPYNFADTQLRTAGSLMIFGTLSNFKTRGDSAILGRRYENDFGSNSHIQEFKSTTLSIAPGYSQSFIHKGYFLNATLALTAAPNWVSYRLDDGKEHSSVKLAAFYMARISIGYSAKRWFTAINYVTQGGNAKYDGIQLLTSSGTMKLLFGYRFREFGILKKRVADIPQLVGIGK